MCDVESNCSCLRLTEFQNSIKFQPLWHVLRRINKAENRSTQKKYKSFSKIEKKKKGKKNVLLSVSSNINFPVHDSARNSWQGERTWLGAEIKTGLRTFQSIN